MDRCDVLSKPVEETIEKKKSKKKKKASGPGDAPLNQLSFVALKEGKCVIFADVSWEDQEEKLAITHGLSAPCSKNSTARIGPLEVDVQKVLPNPPGPGKERAPFLWWAGDKWSPKKGPSKKKKR